jgi:predicted RNA-binding protein YlqC (UPF0109 family)
MKELATFLAKQLVDAPDSVDVQVSEEGDTLRLSLRVADADKGKVIGKQGKVIKAIRQLVGIPGVKTGKKVFLDLE